jgi:hypothetical protein
VATALKAREFLFRVEHDALSRLEGPLPPQRKLMWNTLQLHYGDPAVHFELQPMMSRGLVEVGLHFEGAVEVNDRWAAVIADAAPAIVPLMGPGWELEVWTASWRRLHRAYPFERLTADFAEEVAEGFARLITVTGALVASATVPAPRAARPAPRPRHRPRAARV